MAGRVTDFALLIGHVWRCPECRQSILDQPEIAWIGLKLSEEQRQAIQGLTNESFVTVMRLSEELHVAVRELYEAIDHPRARLRHLGVVRGEFHINR